jgi:hypothetical protein
LIHVVTLTSTTVFEIFLISLSWGTKSKAFEKSITIASVLTPSFSESAISWIFAGYVTVYVQLYCLSFHSLSLHVSAYMAIFRCVGYFYFNMNEGFCFTAFFLPFVLKYDI